MVSKAAQMVGEFHSTYECEMRSLPEIREDDDALLELRYELLREEVEEFKDAADAKDLVEVGDALADILYVAYGAAISFGIDVDALLEEVHSSNMSKLDNGKVRRREDGKVLKGPQFREPNIADVLDRQKPVDWSF